jgi:beta-lactamase superfamily II metal-dependent hydrolase
MIPSSGDATLLRFWEDEDEVNILIDGGNRKNNCINYLKKLEIRRIDLLIVSHLDEDHIRGLKRVADEIDVRELWITNISPLIKPAIELNSLYMLKCFFETSLIVDSRGLQGKDKLAVYEGYERQIGPFHFQVLSPPKSLHNYLGRPDVIRKILKSKKGQTIGNYVKRLLEETSERLEGGEKTDRGEEILSEVIERFEVDTPQLEEIKERIEGDGYDPTWHEEKYYESARSLFNDISIVVNMTYNYHGITKQFLFPGDLTNWSVVLARYPQQIRNHILKVPHHGSEIYVDPEDYRGVSFEKYFDPDLWRTSPDPCLNLLGKWLLKVLMFGGHILPLNDLFFGVPSGRLPIPWSYKDVYEWLSPERALIYPFISHSLPKVNVRNQIINASNAMCCAYKQGSVNEGKHGPSHCCINCYNCAERDNPVVFEWRRARGSSWTARYEEHLR